MTNHTNPYVAGAPVTDQRMFFGREDVFTWIEQNIAGQFSDNMLVIHGQRRVGKTSVLKQLGNYISDQFIPVFFDFQGRTHTTISKFLYRLAREIVRTLTREYGIEIPRPHSNDFELDVEYFAESFIPQVRETLGDKNLVLVFDEFDTLEERTSRDMLGQHLVPYFSRMIHGAQNLNFIFSIGSSGHKLEDMRAEYTDFFRVGLYKRISFLSSANSRRLITEPVQGIMDYEDDAVERVVKITSGHPYFIQLLCHELFAKAQRKDDWHITLDDIEEVLPDVIERGTVNLKFVWDVASTAERYALAALAEIGQAATKEEILKLLRDNRVRISSEEIGHALIELVARDVLSNEYDFRVELMRHWLLENRPLERVVEELAEKHPVAVRHTQIAEEHRDEDQLEKALESYQNALNAAPKYIPAQLGIAEIYHETGRWLEAIEAYEKALKIDAEEPKAKTGLCESLIALGDAERKLEDLEEAKERYQEALKVDPESAEARERLAALSLSQAKSLSSQKKWKAAGENLLEAWQYIPENIQTAPDEEAFQPQNIEELESAITSLQDALAAIRTQLAKDELIKAIELREREQYSAAIAKLEKALYYEPSHSEIQKEIQATKDAERAEGGDKIYTRGKRAFNAQRWSEAISILQRYLELEPDNSRRVRKAESWIQDARLQENLAERYAAARQAIDKGVTRRAIALLKEIKYLEENYRDVDWLLGEARNRWRRDIFTKFTFGAMGILIIGFLSWWFLFKPDLSVETPAHDNEIPTTGNVSTETESNVTAETEFDIEDPAIQVALDTVQNQEPTYQTSFESWDFGPLGPNTQIEGEKLIITSENDQHVSVEMSNLDSDQFAVEFDVRALESSPDGHCVFYTSDGGRGGIETTLASSFHYSAGLEMFVAIGPDQQEYLASTPFDVMEPNTVMLFDLGDQIAIFVNGELAHTAIDPGGSTVYSFAQFAATYTITCEYDNYKFWDLSDVDFSVSTSELDSAVQIAVDEIESAEPYFQTSFDTWDFSEPQENASLESGKLIVTGDEDQSTFISQTTFYTDKFAVEFEAKILEAKTGGHCYLGTGNNDIGFRLHISHDGEVMVDHPRLPIDLVIGSDRLDPSILNTLRLIVIEDQFTLFINGELAFTGLDPEGSVVYTHMAYEADAQTTCEFDNFKLWDLSDVDFSETTDTPVPTSTPVPFAWKRLNSVQFLPRDTVRVLLIDPDDADIWYAATNGAGVYKSVNGGVSWLPIQHGLGRTGITNMVIAHDDPMKLYLSTGEGPPYKTTDGGLNWENIQNGASLNDMGPSDGDVTIDPQDSDHLFYLNSSGLYETTNGGQSWKTIEFSNEISDCGVPTGIRFSSADPSIIILLRGGPFDTCNTIVRSTDGGKTWEPTGIEVFGVFWDDIWIEPYQGNYVYVRSGSTQSSYRSEDAGETWDTHFNDCTAMDFIPEDERTAYCFGWSGWFRRTLDGGQNWQDVYQLSMQDGQALAIAPTDSTKFLVGGNGGAYLSTDSGLSWEDRSSGLGATTSTLTIDSTDQLVLYLESSGDFSGKPWPLYRSTDGGSNWEFVDEAGRNLVVDANKEVLYRIWEKDIWGRQPGENAALMRSYDHGATWEIGPPMPDEIENIHYLYADKNINGKLFVNVIFTDPASNSSDNGCYESLDSGDTWQQTDCKYISDQDIEFITYNNSAYHVNDKVVDPNQPNIKYAGTDGGAFISFNGGVDWAPMNDGLLDGLVIYSLVVDDMSNVYASTPLGVFRLEQK